MRNLIFDPDPCEEWGLVIDLAGGA